MSNQVSDDGRAAARLAGLSSPAGQVTARHSVHGVVGESDWQQLATRMSACSRLTVVGVVPAKLIEAIREILDPSSDVLLPPLEYFTPLPELALNLGHALHCYTTRWHVGYTGLRNLVMSAKAFDASDDKSRPVPPSHFDYGLPMLSFNCLVRLELNGGTTEAVMLSELPGRGDRPEYAIHELPRNDRALDAYFGNVKAEGNPIRLREARCPRPDEAAGDGPADSEHPLRIGALVPLGASISRPNTVRPISIIVVRCQSPGGLEILLKRRSPLTDTDDFGKLSLFSARVQEVDIAAAYSATVSPSGQDDVAALEDLWLAAGSPRNFYLGEDAFRRAAQREVAFLLGLQLDLDRFERKGFHLVDHEGPTAQQLAFTIFSVDLIRSGQYDELRSAMARNLSNIERIPARDIYSDEEQLNRLLRRRRRWLLDNCFSD